MPLPIMFSSSDIGNIAILGLGFASVVYAACFPLAKWLRRRGIIDQPNSRSSHVVPTARGGGVILVAVMLLGLPLMTRTSEVIYFMAGYLLIAGVSFADDLKPLSPLVRLASHLLGAFICTLAIVKGRGFFDGASSYGEVLVGVVIIAGYTNAFNFMDGINGLAAGQAAITGLGTVALGIVAGEHTGSFPIAVGCIVAFSAIGFFPHNFPNARMFMGDVGSAPFGFALAAAAVWLAAHHGLAMAAMLALLHANFLIDTSVTLGRRVIRGENWHQSHREHFYQRLVISGYGHRTVTTVEMVMQIICVSWTVESFWAHPGLSWPVVIFVPSAWIAFFCFCESKFRQKPRSP